ncbi:MAG: glycerophosphodiester phosphodiesterase [Antricoccus sp.]
MSFLNGPLPIAFAHRGGAYGGLENSMEAFEASVKHGYRYIETDVHVTKDGVVVAMHDGDLRRVSGARASLRGLTWDQLRSFQIGDGGTIARLDEVLSAWPQLNLNIDAKSAAVAAPLVEVVRAHDALSRVCLASFSDRRIVYMGRLAGPAAILSMGPRTITALRVASMQSSLGRFLPIAGHCAQVPHRVGRFQVVTRRFVQFAHAIGKQVHVWTIDDPAQMNELLDLGVDGIMTDKPEVLKAVMTDRGVWSGA